MKKLFLFFSLVLLICTSASAKILRVGFFASPIAGTDYTSFNLAYTAATAGDTILVFPNNTVTVSNNTIAKKLTVIGPGNWLDATSTPKGNANQQAFAGTASISSITFASGSDGSVIMGFNGGTIYVNANNITISRNRDILVYIATNSGSANTTTNLQVLQNYRLNFQSYYTNNSSCTNMNISNNFMYYFSTAAGNTYNGNISNNIWAYDATDAANDGGTNTLSYNSGIELGAGAYLLQNNIFASYTNAAAASNYNYFIFNNGGNSVFNYNLILQSYNAINLGTGIGNVVTPIANAANIFSAFPLIASTSADARYQLKSGSPALVANRPGSSVDAGMYAGTTPYKLSTIPTIPSVYALSSPQGNNPPGSTIQISVSTRGNN